MILRVNNKKYNFFESVNVTLRYDSVASTFSFDAYFNPENEDHKALFRPLSFHKAVIEFNGEKLITGTILNHGLISTAKDELKSISGYSLTGVLEDCEIPVYPLQSNGLSLKNMAERIAKAFDLQVVVDPAASSKANEVYNTTTSEHRQKAKEFLAEHASQKNLVVSHDEEGRLLITVARTNQQPLYDFASGMPGVKYVLETDGQGMHSKISVIGQASMFQDNARHSEVINPYVSVYRPKVVTQTSSNENDAQPGARNYLSEELKNIRLTIELDRWVLNNKIIRPGNIVTVQNPDLFLFKKTKFFIEQVSFFGNAKEQRATLSCVIPEVYNSQTPKNIFA